MVEDAINRTLAGNLWVKVGKVDWTPGKIKTSDFGFIGKLSKEFNGEIIITAKLPKDKVRQFNSTYDMQEKLLPKEINTSIVNRVGESVKNDYKVWSKGFTKNDDGTVSFKYSVPYHLYHQ
jgi:hypothetical protein